jgi:anti-sigma B factor antagonist
VALLCDLPYILPSMNVSSDFPSGIGVRVAEHGLDARVVTVVGQVDTPTALELATSLIAQLAVARVVVVDLDGVMFLGSAGLSALFEADELATQQDHYLRLVCNSRSANWALAAAGLRDCFTFADSVPDALKDSPSMQSAFEAGVARRHHRNRSRRSPLRNSGVVRCTAGHSLR